MSILDFTILSFGTLFVIVDPIGLVPAFLAMTHNNTILEKTRMAGLASLVTFLILLLFSVAGQWLFNAFGISLPAFEIAGGIILLLIALDMLRARRTAIKETPEEQAEGMSKDDIAIAPLAVPMLAGPGAITAVVLLGNQAGSVLLHLVLIANIFLVSLITFLVLRVAAVRSSITSVIAMKVITRLMGLLLAAFAVQFILDGIVSAQLI